MSFKNKCLVLSLSFLLAFVSVPNKINIIQKSEAATINQFVDVKPGFWAYNEIQELKNKKIVEALSKNNFEPNKEITRSKAARMIVKSLGIEDKTYNNVSFQDVPKSHEDYKYIALSVQEGIFSGKNSVIFDPNGKLTRAQMAKVLTISLDLRTREKANFVDVSQKHWAYEYVNAMYQNNITFAPNGKYLPNDSSTRAHQAVFLYRAMKIPKLPEFMKDVILFDKNIAISSYTLSHPLFKKILLDGQEVVRKNEMKFIDASYGIEVQSEGYKNPKDKNFKQINLTPDSSLNDGKSFFLRFDFRDAKAVDVASNWFDLLVPQAKLSESIKNKALDAKKNEHRGIMYEGSMEIIKVDGYKIKYGVNSMFNFFNIEVEYVGK